MIGEHMGRTAKSVKNIYFGLISRGVTVLLSFVTRTFMIKLMGIEVVSINSLFNEVISAISLAELGIGSAIVFNLYKPLAEDDKEKVCQLMNLFKKAYLIIALVTLALGIIVCPFLEYFINDISYSFSYLRIIYMLFVIQCASSYLFSYKTALLSANEKNYVYLKLGMICKTIGTIGLIVVLITTKKYILYLTSSIALTIVTNVICSNKVDKMYPYISQKSQLPKEERKKIFDNVKNIFAKQLAGKVVNSTDNILISSLVSTLLVGYYSNYAVVISVFKQISEQVNNSLVPSVGNLFATETPEKCERTLFRLTYIFYLFASVSAVGIYGCIQPFITMWVGADFLLDIPVVFVSSMLLFVYILYKPLSTAMHMTGQFSIGRNISIISAVANLVVSLVLGIKIGIVGIFLGTMATYIIEVISKIHYVYKLYFKKSSNQYVFMWIKMIAGYSSLLGMIHIFMRSMTTYNVIIQFIVNGMVSCIIVLIVNISLFYKTDEFAYCCTMVKQVIRRGR